MQTIVQVLGVLAGIVIVLWQLRSQRRDTLEQQRSLLREQLRLEIYQDIAGKLVEASEALSVVGALCATVVRVFRIRRDALDRLTIDIGDSGQRTSDEVNAANYNANQKVLAVVRVFEAYEIAFPGFKPFQIRILLENDNRDKTFQRFYTDAVEYLNLTPLMKLADPEKDRPDPPENKKVAEFDGLVRHMEENQTILIGYFRELRTAAQNHLLGDIFPNSKVPGKKSTGSS